MDIKEFEELIQSGRNTPLTRFPNEPPKVELHTVVDVSDMCAAELLSEVENICRICRIEMAEQPDLIEKIIGLLVSTSIRPIEVARRISERLRFGMSLDNALVWVESNCRGGIIYEYAIYYNAFPSNYFRHS